MYVIMRELRMCFYEDYICPTHVSLVDAYPIAVIQKPEDVRHWMFHDADNMPAKYSCPDVKYTMTYDRNETHAKMVTDFDEDGSRLEMTFVARYVR